jgi:cytochrome P450
MPEWLDVAQPHVTWETLSSVDSPVWFEDHGVWLVHRPADVERVARDTETFSSAVPGLRSMELDFLLTVDPPKHKLERAAFVRHFGPRIHAVVAGARTTVAALAGGIPAGEVVDLSEALFRPLGGCVSRQILGSHGEAVAGLPSDAAWREVSRLLIAGAGAHSTDDSPAAALFDDLCRSGVSPDVARGRVAGLVCAMLVASDETLPAAMALALLQIATGRKVAVSTPVAADTPLLGLYRLARKSVTIGSAKISRGQRVFLAWGAANYAATGTDFSYGVGPHRCPAAMMVNAVVGAVISHVQTHWNVELAEPVFIAPHSHFRGPQALRCEIEPTCIT